MRSLRTGKRSNWRGLSRWGYFSQSDISALVPEKFHQLSPMRATLPVPPQDRVRSGKRRLNSGFRGWSVGRP